MRDILITAIILGALPFVLFRPYVGAVLWAWVSVMNPHRLAWGFAYDWPFAQMIAIATLISLVLNWRKWRFPPTPLTLTLIAFLVWMTVTLAFALHFDDSIELWVRTAKMLLFTLITVAVVRSEKEIKLFVWVLVLSVVFFGVKGGIFTIMTGGQSRVYGPEDSHIGDNNAISVALVMMIPLLLFLIGTTRRKSIRFALVGSAVLSMVAVLGSYSRGAVVATVGMASALIVKSRKGWLVFLAAIAIGPVVLMQMPDTWYSRIETIGEYNTDTSVQGRFNAWQMAWNLALSRPIVGGGFAVDMPDVFARYAPNPEDVHSAHSIYFQILGEHGFVGLAIFIALGVMMWRTGARVIAAAKGHKALQWAADLAKAIQVSMVGFAVGGVTVNIGYWDVIYFELAILVALEQLVLNPSPAARDSPHETSGWLGARASGEAANASTRRREIGEAARPSSTP